MKVLMLAQFYRPEPCAGANRVAAIAEHLHAAGHQVHVLTGFPSAPLGVIPPEYRRRLCAREEIEGVRVTRLWTYASPHLSGRNRLLNWGSLAASATMKLLASSERFDILYVSSPPITLALPAVVGALRHRARLVVDIRDCHPEVAIRMGLWKERSLVARAVGRVAEALYRRADCVMCVTQSMREDIAARGCDPEKILVAPNGFDRIEPSAVVPFQRKDGEFIAVFVGNFGLIQGVDVLLEASALLADEPRVRFVFVGGGADFRRLRERADDDGFRNVEFLGVRPREEAMAALRDADVCLVPLRRNVNDSLPTKLFDALSLGCPAIVCADGEARTFIERSSGGWCVPPEDPRALAQVIRRIIDAPGERAACARSGRAYVEEHCSRARSLASIERRMEAVASRTPESTERDECALTT